jgi:hypothetical protein
MLHNPVSILEAMIPAYRDPATLEGVQTGTGSNSAAPATATLSNTAAGYTTLGGQWKFAAAGGAETDYALFAYQVPANQRLWVNGISISSFNTGAAVATTVSTLEWSLGLNSTAVSLATTDAAPVFGPRRIALGAQSFPVGAAIGATATDVSRYFENALRIDAGRFFHVILKCPVGTATGSQIIRGDCTIDGYFEPLSTT